MSRNPSPLQVLVAVAALAVVAAAIAWLPSDGGDLPEALEISAADASEVAAFNANNGAPALGQAPATPAAAQPVALPVPQDGGAAAAPAAAVPAAPAAPATPATPATPAAAAPMDDTTTTAAPAPAAPDAPSPAPAADPAPAPKRDNGGGGGGSGGYISRAQQEGYDVHDFVEHTVALLGTRAMEPGQARTGGYEISNGVVRAFSTITGQRPVIEQAIDDVKAEAPNATGQDLERRIAQRLTELNDWKNLNRQTQENMMVLTGVDIADMDKRLREDTINHLLHSPLPFGYIDDVLTPDMTVEMGYTHTLDKDWTEAAHLGDGVFQILMISNNNNGSHTGHVMGSFKVRLTPTTTLAEARDVGNDMVENRNKNNKLYLDEAARRILYGQTPRLDFSGLSEAERKAIYDGRGLGNAGPSPIDVAPTQPEEPDTTDTTAETDDTTDETTETTDESTTDETTEATDETVANDPPAEEGDPTDTSEAEASTEPAEEAPAPPEPEPEAAPETGAAEDDTGG